VHHIIVVALVALAYVALAAVSELIAYSPADAWTVWLSSGVVLGSLLVQPRARWAAILAGAFIGATAFALTLGSSPFVAAGYGCIEVIACGLAAFVVTRIVDLPMGLERPRDLAALILGGALPLALTGAALATVWHVADGGTEAAPTFRVWMISNVIGTLLVAPLVIAWSRFRLRRSGGMTMPTFAGGAIACFLFLGLLWLIFDARPDARFGGSVGASLTYLPIVFMALVALLWGTRGATLAAFAGALIAMVNTAQGEGPFAGLEGFLGEAELEVEGYALAIAMTGLLIAVLAASQRSAMRAARDWQTRFEATIGAHRLLAYEWDPASGRMIVTGDSTQMLGVAPAKLATLADWLALVGADERDAVSIRFEQRAEGSGAADALAYRMAASGSGTVEAHDEARAIRDHDGAMHRVVGIVRLAAPAGAADAGGAA
jgi:integral membrane sensor domain MASE1